MCMHLHIHSHLGPCDFVLLFQQFSFDPLVLMRENAHGRPELGLSCLCASQL